MAPIDPRVESLTLLRSIDASLKTLIGLQRAPASAPTGERVDLDGPHGDPTVRAKDPRDWTGEPMKGRHFSECPADYLDMLAERFDYFAGQEDDAKKAKYNRLDAARARGWAQRIRSGHVPQTVAAGGDGGGEDFNGTDDWENTGFGPEV